MGAPGGGRNPITLCFLRHFNAVSINEFDDEIMTTIFNCILTWHQESRGFSRDFEHCIEELVQGTLAVYKEAMSCLLPTPKKSHYLFNLQDFSRVVQGLLLSLPETAEDQTSLKRLCT
ncbi:dynein axonemal heavy chain 7-like [Tachypleus tridentatus]|uniref:dynein axonemal heavy chain 7-like n=1 Tax=Tachypleus tridentatus TaxID=6853 RepID=UPI003FD5FC92